MFADFLRVGSVREGSLREESSSGGLLLYAS
jgi:hypothetical protein